MRKVTLLFALFAAVCLSLASCSNNIKVFLPRGPEGADGQSAYEQWVEMVAEGLEDPHNPPDLWPKDETDVYDFYRYLSGRDGLDGNSGGGNPGDGGGGNDGNDGKSAYDLWVEDVTDADGLDNPHTPEPGDEWPRTDTSLDAFWRYLSGDGDQSHNTIVEPGQPGIEFHPVGGKPNVIALYFNNDMAHSEYVSTVDGSVTYQVYKDDGTTAGSGVSVTEMPGVLAGPAFSTEADGTFKVPANRLPTSGDITSRYGSVKVDGVPSASNTYVPQKVNVRLMIGRYNLASPMLVPELVGDSGDVLNGGVYINVPVRAQRRMTSEGDWEDLPDWLGAVVSGSVHPYALDLSADPVMTSEAIPYRSHQTQDLRGVTVGVRRPTLRADWLMPESDQEDDYYLWEPDVTPEAFTLAIDSADGLYGEKPSAKAVVLTAPVNFHPLPEYIIMADTGTAGVLSWTGGRFKTSTIETAGRFVAKYERQDDVDDFEVYGPLGANTDNSCLGVRFLSPDTNTDSGGPNLASIGNPDFNITSTVYVGSTVYLQTTRLLVAGTGDEKPIGTLIENPDYPTESYKYVIRASGSPFTFDDIPVYATRP